MEKMDKADYYTNLAIAARNDAKAFSELYTYYFPRVYNFIFSRVRNVDIADEIISMSFEKVFLNLHTFDQNKASFSTWLFRITLNTLSDYFRRVNRRKEMPWNEEMIIEIGIAEGPDTRIIIDESKRDLLLALDQLSEKERRVIVLKYWSELSNKEIAKIENISETNVGVFLFRTIKKLKTIIEECL